MNRAGNSRNQAVIRAKLTVLSRLAAIQIELTIVMHWKGGELRGKGGGDGVAGGGNGGGDDSFDFRLDRHGEPKA